ncbi:MAG: DNA-directed DNA polymerase II large subunit [Candidatus Heimdallarchaeota archaeon]|nr:DNA-directed DNA polymerase II large subunit [Candidatus Heimdallarchaeota archaeon]
MEIIASDEMKAYFQQLEYEVKKLYEIAKEARKKGLDPKITPEIHLAKDVAEKVEGLIELKGIAKRITRLSEQMDRENVAFKIAQEVAEGRFGVEKSEEKRADRAIRAALAILTEGVTAAPLEGIAKVKLKYNDDNSRYLAVYFAGPIRSAGGTEAALTVLIADHVRQVLGLSEYRATKKEMKRFVEEINLYNRVMHLQSPTTADQIEKAVEKLPIEITGESTNPEEVSAFRDLPRIETNSLRGGACLVLNDGIIGRAMKILRTVTTVGLTGWDWLKTLKVQVSEKEQKKKAEEKRGKTQPSYGYIKDVIAGRPIFAHPSALGGFRIRYGHSRNTGLAGIGIHPSTMKIVKEFLAPGTHIRTERPGKGSVVMPVDTIDGPTVLLKNDSVVRLNSYKEAEKCTRQIKEILFLGDLLVGFGEFLENNHPLIPSGYVEEWWVLHLESKIKSHCMNDLRKAAEKCHIPIERIQEFLEKPLETKPTQEEALAFSRELGIPLHPYYTYTWHDITFEEYFDLREEVLQHMVKQSQEIFLEKGLILKKEFKAKRILERLGLPHKVKDGEIIIDEHHLILKECLQLDNANIDRNSLEAGATPPLEKIVPIQIMAKVPIYAGARMGRPEKAKERKMSPPIHSLYPIEMSGGKQRQLLKAGKKKKVNVTVVQKVCPKCQTITHLPLCPKCQTRTEIVRACPSCGVELSEEFCETCRRYTSPYNSRKINIRRDIVNAKKRLGGSVPSETKGVKKLMNRTRTPEIIEKGFLRARHDLNVYKDGTIRFDSTDIPLMHFKPREIGVSIEQLKELGYKRDIHGKSITHEEQIIELKVQDVVLNIENGVFLARVANFVDDMLDAIYGLPRFYNIKRISDLIGHMVIGLAPHTSSGITGRIIGFSSVKGNLAHPYWHAAKRRNCFPGDTEVLVTINEKITRISVKELYEDLFKDETIEKFVQVKKQPKQKILAYSFNQKSGETLLSEIEDVIKTTSPNHLIRFNLATGRSFKTTHDHPVVICSKNKMIEKKALEVEEGDLCVLPKMNIKEKDFSSFDLLEEYTKESYQQFQGNLRIYGIGDFVRKAIRKHGLAETAQKINVSKKILGKYYNDNQDAISLDILLRILKINNLSIKKVPNCFLGFKNEETVVKKSVLNNSHLMKLIGFYIAKGCYKKENDSYQIYFAVIEKELQKELLQSLSKAFGAKVKPIVNEKGITVPGKIIYHIFKDVLGLKEAPERRIPEFICKLPQEKVQYFLSSAFNGEVNEDGSLVYYSSINYGLIKDLDLLLLRFGIYGCIDKINRDFGIEYKFKICGKDLLKFTEKIGCLSKKREAILSKLSGSNKNHNYKMFKNNRLLEVQSIDHIKRSTDAVYSLNVKDHHTILVNEHIVTHQCDGDEDAILLMLEAFLNFSKEFLPITRGGSMDAPLTLGIILNPLEVDDESHAVDCLDRYPLELYEQSYKFLDPKKMAMILDLLGNRLETTRQYEDFRYTHETSDIATGPPSTAYSRLEEMSDKLDAQLEVARLIRAVDLKDVAERVINKHFFPDMIGCLRAFGTQTFRCVRCNTKFRRLPLTGKCTKCPDGGKLLLTVHKKTITKYFDTAKKLIEKYHLSNYISQRLELFDEAINEMFGKEQDLQQSLTDFFN